MAPPLLRFQTDQLRLWTIRRSVKIRRVIGFDSINEAPVYIKLNRKIRSDLNLFIPISAGISQSKSRIAAESDIASIRISVKMVSKKRTSVLFIHLDSKYRNKTDVFRSYRIKKLDVKLNSIKRVNPARRIHPLESRKHLKTM